MLCIILCLLSELCAHTKFVKEIFFFLGGGQLIVFCKTGMKKTLNWPVQ